MKKIGNYLYDEAGICPACGRIMRSVRYYEGEKGTTVNMGTSGRYTHYSTSYKNIKEKLAGYCENCDRNAFNAKEENWPKPGIGNWIAMAVSNADYSLSDELGSEIVAGDEVGYYVQVIYYDPSVYQGEIPMTVDFLSEDNVTKYAYDVVIGG